MPPLLQPNELQAVRERESVRVIDLSPPEHFAAAHIPGAVHLPYARIVHHRPPVAGLLPPRERLQALYRELGLAPDTLAVALDAEGGATAGRLLWTLNALGHGRCALLDGGLHAWQTAGLPLTAEATPPPEPAGDDCGRDNTVVADAEYILQRLEDPDFRLLDARSIGEYDGSALRAARGGHIPGARHYEWTRGLDPASHRMRPGDELRAELAALDITPEHEVVVYCHSHHRSGFSYWMLRCLGLERVRGYPGSWSDWGNREDLPVKTGADSGS